MPPKEKIKLSHGYPKLLRIFKRQNSSTQTAYTMYDEVLVQLTDQRAVGVLNELEDLQLIKVLKTPLPEAAPQRLSDKYRGIMGKKAHKQLHSHVQQMRHEWKAIW